MDVVKRAIPILILLSAAYGGWYYWQSRPTDPLAVRIFQLEPEEVVKITIKPVDDVPFDALRVNSSWQLNDGERHLVESSLLPDTLLSRLLVAQSEDLIEADSVGRLQVEIQMETRTADSYQMYIHCASKDDCQKIAIRIAPRPEFVLVDGLRLGDLPLAFTDYRNPKLYDLAPLGRLDSVVWQDVLGQNQTWSYADSRQMSSQLFLSAYANENYADYFDEITHRDRYAGSYRVYGARQDLELRVAMTTLAVLRATPDRVNRSSIR